MSTTRLARWFLLRLARGPQRESLIGDLDEQLARGRPSFWYWRQAVSAIVAGLVGDLRDDKMLAAWSAVLSFALVFGWVEMTLALYLWVSEAWVNARVGGFQDSGLLFVFWHPFAGGLGLIWCVGSLASGWLIAQRSRPAMLLAAAVAQFPLALWLSRSVWLDAERWSGAPAHIWLPVYAGAIIVTAGLPGATLLGALWGGCHGTGR
jgi:hypothetical protein